MGTNYTGLAAPQEVLALTMESVWIYLLQVNGFALLDTSVMTASSQ